MKILITGCNGQLGNEMQLLENDYPQHTFINTDVNELDITDKKAVTDFVNSHDIDGIVNCAAFTAVDKAESNKELCKLLNADAPAFLAKAIEQRGGWLIQISTDYVFDGTKHTPYVETDDTCPTSTYGSTKLDGERNAINGCRRTVIIRTAWLYSTFGNNFVKTMIKLGRSKESLGVVFDQIGSPTYAADLADAIMHIINTQIVPGIYHFSNDGVASWYDFTKAIHRLAGITTCDVKPIHTSEYPTPATRPAYSVLDKTKIKQSLGVNVPYWEESLRRCIEKML